MKLTNNYSLVGYGSEDDYIFCKNIDVGKIKCVELAPSWILGKETNDENAYASAEREYKNIDPEEAYEDMMEGGFDDDDIQIFKDFSTAFWKKIATDR